MHYMYGTLASARPEIDRDVAGRDSADPAAGRCIYINGSAVAIADGRLYTTPATQLASEAVPSYLGRHDGTAYFACVVSANDIPDGVELRDLRHCGPWLSEVESSMAVSAIALANWHNTCRFCPTCGKPVTDRQGGWQHECPDGHIIFPRMDPAVIMAVHDSSDRLLLGRNRSWPDGRYSTLAGFVEVGETFESAVRREVMEEVGLRIGRLQYFASQPWPYPRSVMVGFHAWCDDGDIQLDECELSDAFFITRDELRQRVHNQPVFLPGLSAIARALIEDWYGEQLPPQALKEMRVGERPA